MGSDALTDGSVAPLRFGEEASSLELLRAMWREVLDREAIGLDENFFDLGGTSALAVDLRLRLEAAMGESLPLIEIFRNPTVRTLAAALAARSAVARRKSDDLGG